MLDKYRKKYIQNWSAGTKRHCKLTEQAHKNIENRQLRTQR